MQYQRKISDPAIARTLKLQLQTASPHVTADSQEIRTYYSTFRLPANSVSQMQAHDTWLVLKGPLDTEVLLTEVGSPTGLSGDGNFTFYADSLNTQPATSWQVFTMSDTEFESHLKLINGKAATPYADTVVSYFETYHAKGSFATGLSGTTRM